MNILFEVMALFFIISNNFTTGTLNCELERFLRRNVLVSHAIAVGILYNLIDKASPADERRTPLLSKLLVVYGTFYLLILQHPVLVCFDAVMFTVLGVVRGRVAAGRRDAFDAAVTCLLVGVIALGAAITYASKPAAERGDFFLRRATCA